MWLLPQRLPRDLTRFSPSGVGRGRRVDKLSKAVIVAREEANAREVERREISDSLFDYLFPPSILESGAQA